MGGCPGAAVHLPVGRSWLGVPRRARVTSCSLAQDLSHATIEMYTSIGRTRSAKLVGKDLAEFYM